MAITKKLLNLPLDELIPYENNPRINDDAVDDVAVSSPKKNNSKQLGTSDRSSGKGGKKKFLFF